MKKTLTVLVAFLGLLVMANKTQAQSKIGYINVDQVIGIMPEAAKIDSMVQKFQVDSINSEFASVVQEYQYKDSLLNKTDTSKMPAVMKTQYKDDLNNLAYQIQNWQSLAQQAVQAKQNRLLEPLYIKAYDAIKAVAKEGGYAYVLTREAILVGPPGDDMLPAVAKKLGIKLPPVQKTN